LRTQNLQLEKQQEHILELSSQLGELKESFVLLEEKSLLTKETSGLIVDNSLGILNSNLFYWCVCLLVLIVLVYFASIFYAKVMNFSILSLLPKIEIPYDLIPFVKKSQFFEFIVGEYSIRFSVKEGVVTSVHGKGLDDMEYLPIEELLAKGKFVGTDILARSTEVLSSPGCDLSIKSASASISTVEKLSNTIAATEAIQATETLSSIFSVI